MKVLKAKHARTLLPVGPSCDMVDRLTSLFNRKIAEAAMLRATKETVHVDQPVPVSILEQVCRTFQDKGGYVVSIEPRFDSTYLVTFAWRPAV